MKLTSPTTIGLTVRNFELQMEKEMKELKRQRDLAQSQLDSERKSRKELKVFTFSISVL